MGPIFMFGFVWVTTFYSGHVTITPSREPHARDPTPGPYQISLKAITFHVHSHSRGNRNKARNLLVKATVSFGYSKWPHENDMSLPTWHPVPLPCKNN